MKQCCNIWSQAAESLSPTEDDEAQNESAGDSEESDLETTNGEDELEEIQVFLFFSSLERTVNVIFSCAGGSVYQQAQNAKR